MGRNLPTLWHLEVSHYSEKARWAFDFKRVDHVRRAPLPGAHMTLALYLTGGASATLPILQLDGRTVADSTAVIAAVEELQPDPPLYPADPELRRRALELEDFFDEELGPHIRLLAFHELARDPEVYATVMERTAPGALARVPLAAAAYGRVFTGLRFGVHDEQAAVLARTKVLAALDRLERELGSDRYLVGDAFSVADLTAASLFSPLVLPDGGPLPSDLLRPKGMETFHAPLEGRPGFGWVSEMYRRHRRPARAAVAV